MWYVKKTLIFLYKQSVYKQLALGWQIAKQLSGLNPFSLSNNKNYRLQKSGVAVKRTTDYNSAFSKALLGKFKIIIDHKYQFWILKIIAFLVDIGYSVKLLSDN